MTIPEVRQRIEAIAAELLMFRSEADLERAADELRALVAELRRRPNGNLAKAPRHSRSMTPGLAERIRQDAAAHPADSMFTVAARHGVNQGRVSEAIYGKRR